MFLGPDDWALLAKFQQFEGLTALKDEGLVRLASFFVGATESVLRPAIAFRTWYWKGPHHQCPFLVNDLTQGSLRGLCSLHPQFKPLVCRLSPLSRTVEGPPGTALETWSLVAPVEGCPGMGRGEVLEPVRPPAFSVALDREAKWVLQLVGDREQLQSEDSAWNYYLHSAPAFDR